MQVLRGIDLEIKKEEVVSIVGPSGAGKTTLLQIMGTLDMPDSGSVMIDGTLVNRLNEKELSAFRNRHIGFVFQFHQLLPEFTALENVMIPAFIAGVGQQEARAAATEILDFMGLTEHLFEPFTKGDVSRKSGSGSGLGLSIAKKIIEMHGFQMDFIQQLDEKKIPQIAGYTKEFVIQIADDSYDSSLTA